jgi:phosphatidylinositol glycan class S
MRTFSAQLLSLLGLPESPSSWPIRISTLQRVHAASVIYSASNSIGALARLVRQFPHIAIPDEVAASVERSIAHLGAACTSLGKGRFVDALREASVAEQEADRAFFDKAMMAQGYAPNEHKFAIYIPFFFSVGLPLVSTTLKEFRAMRKRATLGNG